MPTIVPIIAQKSQICLQLVYITKQRVLISEISIFYFIFVANDLSDSHFRKKLIVGILIGKVENTIKEIQYETDTYKTKET